MTDTDRLAEALAAANAVIEQAMALLTESSVELVDALSDYRRAVDSAEPVLRRYQHVGDVWN